MYWLNIRFADGSESDFRNSTHFGQKATAFSHAKEKAGVSGADVYVIDNGTVIAAYRPVSDTPDSIGKLKVERFI